MIQCVGLYEGKKGAFNVRKKICPRTKILSRMYMFNVTWLIVDLFESPRDLHHESVQRRDAEFRLNFSFPDSSALPEKLANDSWNCSGPSRPALLYHLYCNLEAECQDAADEVACPYTTKLCGPGYLSLGGTCFFYARRKEPDISWYQARVLCYQRGGRMANINSQGKWADVFRLLPEFIPDAINVYLGLRNMPPSNQPWYAHMFQWTDGTTAFYLDQATVLWESCYRACGCIYERSVHLENSCSSKILANVLCEKTSPSALRPVPSLSINGTGYWPRNSRYVKCPSSHYSHHFLVCDDKSSCWYHHSSSYCQSSRATLLPLFACEDKKSGLVPYTLVCNHRFDCADHSDENCEFLPCTMGHFKCKHNQCIASRKLCDGWTDCYSGDDEDFCSWKWSRFGRQKPPAVVEVSNEGRVVFKAIDSIDAANRGQTCPYTHFQCPDNGFCLPVFFRCNGVLDCPGREDEQGCDACPGFYRCRASQVCLMYSHLCDGHGQCPQDDDEMLCSMTCPSECFCQGHAYVCSRIFSASAYPHLRYLDASGSGIHPANLTQNDLLIHLVLANCGLVNLDELSLPNLLILEAHNNLLNTISHLHLGGFPKLRKLSLDRNPLALVFEGSDKHQSFGNIQKLSLSHVALHVLNVTALSAFSGVRVLNLSHSGVRRVLGDGFNYFEQLSVIDLRGCPMTRFPRRLFQDLRRLQSVHAHNFKICCPAVLPPGFNLHNCFAPEDEISTCDNLLRERAYSVCVFALSAFAMGGNAVSFVFRTYLSKREKKRGFGNFVTHLSLSDFVMGVYLAIIGLADQVYHGTYAWNEVAWKHSVTCTFAGILSLLSSEVSVLIMCLITIDRFLVIRFPFSQLHFRPLSAHAASVMVWIAGMVLVFVPLLPMTSHWEFYSQTGICIPLPTTVTDFAGHDYSFGILIIFNFVVFVIISMGQISIYWSVRANAMSVSNTTKKAKDLTIAHRLITVAMTDFLCWFPVCIVGLLASNGVSIPGELNGAVAIFVLPLNAAVNPCLYTVNVILERRNRAREDKLKAALLAQLKASA